MQLELISKKGPVSFYTVLHGGPKLGSPWIGLASWINEAKGGIVAVD